MQLLERSIGTYKDKKSMTYNGINIQLASDIVPGEKQNESLD